MTTNPTTWNLYLDDLRDPKDPYWIVCRSTEEALKEVAARGMPTSMSLDHDLGGDDTTMIFLRRLIDEYWVGECPPDYIVHSQNPVGRENIIAFMGSWARATNSHVQRCASSGAAPIGTCVGAPMGEEEEPT